MKKLIIISCYIVIPLLLNAQTNTFPATGSVGIGAPNPMGTINNKGLQIDYGAHSAILLGDPINKHYGGIIQTTDNKHRVYIGANLYDDPINSWRNFEPGKGSAGISIVADKGGWGTSIQFYLSDKDSAVNKLFVINSDTTVGIGTAFPQSMLSVNGAITAKQVKVMQTGWPDFVFDSTYQLRPLPKLKEYILSNKHLPGILPAKEITEGGNDLGQTDAKLLRKIEELTLYIIRQNERIEALEKKVQILNGK